MAGTDRYEELDAARGIAILMMILFHTLFDLYFFNLYPVNVISGFWRFFAFSTASLFLFIAGISLSISYARTQRSPENPTSARIFLKYGMRGSGIFACGLLVTLVTWLYLGEGFVVFGILHVIGVSIMLAPFFFRFRQYNILTGAVVIVAGMVLSMAGTVGPIWLLPIGIHPASFWSVDYTPVIPWTGVVLAGIGAGTLMYPGGIRGFSVPDLPSRAISALSFLGRHSLVIYLVHQPVILLVLQGVSGIPLFP